MVGESSQYLWNIYCHLLLQWTDVTLLIFIFLFWREKNLSYCTTWLVLNQNIFSHFKSILTASSLCKNISYTFAYLAAAIPSPIFTKLLNWVDSLFHVHPYSQSDWFNSTWYVSVMLFVFNLLSSAGKVAVSPVSLRRRMWWGKWISLQQSSHYKPLSHRWNTYVWGVSRAALNWNTWIRLLWHYTVNQSEYDNTIRNQQGYLGNGDMTMCLIITGCSVGLHELSLNNLPYISHLIKCINYPIYSYIM